MGCIRPSRRQVLRWRLRREVTEAGPTDEADDRQGGDRNGLMTIPGGAGIDDPGDRLKDPESQNKASRGVGASVGHQWVLKTGR